MGPKRVKKFSSIVGNQGEAFQTARSENVSAPMDFAIILGWQVSFLFSFFTLVLNVLYSLYISVVH